MSDEKQPAPEKGLEEYASERWHGLPLYRSPVRREFATIDAAEFRSHLRRAGVKARPAPKPPAPAKDRFGNELPGAAAPTLDQPPASKPARKKKA